jgi:hypothetical protein
MTVFKMKRWAISRIDKYIRIFLWRGHGVDNIRGGHCLVNWKTCLMPKKLRGPGIKDLEKFGRALRLCWLWYGWDSKERPWKQLLKVTDPLERQLFFISTTIQIENGRNTPFWEARWLQGLAPKDLAPSLYNSARFKTRSV